MRTRTIFGILLVLVAFVAFGPALIAVGSQQVAEAFGCQVDLNRAIPCVIGGKDYGQTFYDLGFSNREIRACTPLVWPVTPDLSNICRTISRPARGVPEARGG